MVSKPTKTGILTIAVLVIALGIAIAAPMERLPAEVTPSGAEIEVPRVAIDKSPAIKERLMVPAEYSLDRDKLREKGCVIVHELTDALALECPKGVGITGAIEDKRYTKMDMGANVQINADDVWNPLGYTGTGVTVAVLDTGVDYNHQELIGDISGGKSFVSYTTDYFDDDGHGTHVAGIITATGIDTAKNARGVAPDADVWAGKVLDGDGSGYATDIAKAIEYIVLGNDKVANSGDEPAKIISMSLGGGGTTQANCDRDYLAKKVNWAVANGVTVVVAAGNNANWVSSPGCASKAIAVGAVDKNDVRAYFSGTGAALDIMAPGVAIYSSTPGNTYASWPGTSMATPHVAATVALMKQKDPGLTDAKIKEALYETAVDLGTSGWDKHYGYGRVDAYAAVSYDSTEPPVPPTQCVPNGSACNCNGKCDKKENPTSCPWDCK